MNDDKPIGRRELEAKLREAFCAGARAFFVEDKVAREWQERSLPGAYALWKKQEGLAEELEDELKHQGTWTCPTCNATGQGDVRHQPMYCEHCMFGPGKWVEVTWSKPEEKGA